MKNVLILVLIVAGFCGCLKGGDNTSSFTCNYNECEKVAPAAQIDSLKTYLAIHGITATQHCSGMFYTVDTLGTGANPAGCSYVAFSYEGKLLTDSTFEKSPGPVAANMANLVLGVRNGLQKVKAGGHIHLYIPPSLGYGTEGRSPSIPPNAYLKFDIALIAVQ